MYERYAERALQIIRENMQGNEMSVLSLCKRLGIMIKWIEGSELSSGYASIITGQAYIFLNKILLPQDATNILAHELAHILLGHVGDWHNVVGRKLSKKAQEKEVRCFADTIIKAGSKIINIDEIEKCCYTENTTQSE